jgi:hypothetical protein
MSLHNIHYAKFIPWSSHDERSEKMSSVLKVEVRQKTFTDDTGKQITFPVLVLVGVPTGFEPLDLELTASQNANKQYLKAFLKQIQKKGE